MSSEILITSSRVATLIALRRAQVDTMARRNQIPSVELPNGERRFDPVELKAWVRDLKESRRAEAETK